MQSSKKFKKTLFFLGGMVLLFTLFIFLMGTGFFDKKTLAVTPPSNAMYLDNTKPIEVRVANLLSYMTLEEKVGQMTLVEKNSVKTLSDISSYNFGGLLSGSGAKPEINTVAGWREMILSYQAEAQNSRLAIPLFYGVDAVHGHAHVPGLTVFPHAIGLGATDNPQLVEAVAKATAEELSLTGVNWSFSPNLDQPQDMRWGRVYETFSDDPLLVSKLGSAYIRGLQDKNDSKVPVLATVKHYVGLGGMQWNTSLNKNFKIDQGVTPADEATLWTVYLPPFAEAIDNGALSVMAGLNTWGDKRLVLQKYLLTDVLKEELNFKGFVVSDWYGVYEGRKNLFLATVQAVNAGVDMVMLPFDYQSFLTNMKWANRLGLISDARIDEAVGRILYAKFAMGLFDQASETSVAEKNINPDHKALARQAVSESLVLLKNTNEILPLSGNVKHIQVAGSAADNVGQQMGGWSIEWQGVDGNWPEGSTSILAGIKARAGQGVVVDYNLQGEFSTDKKAEVGIAILGEKPYSEGWGDNEYPTISQEDLQAIEALKKTSEQVVVIVVSGRPLFITEQLADFDALVIAWLPGSEGEGVADVLFGDQPFTGKLPLPWPSQLSQLPITSAGVTADGTSVLFPRYFSL